MGVGGYGGGHTSTAVSPASAEVFHLLWSSCLCCKYSECSYSAKMLTSRWVEVELPVQANSFPLLAFLASQIEKGTMS